MTERAQIGSLSGVRVGQILAVGLAVTLASGCAQDDLGQPCPMDLEGVDTGRPGATGSADLVEINTAFPCESLLCVATDGLEGYCSRECRSDVGCPSAFECAEVDEVGPFAGRKFCVWRRCQVSFECGDVQRYKCEQRQTGSWCTFADD